MSIKLLKKKKKNKNKFSVSLSMQSNNLKQSGKLKRKIQPQISLNLYFGIDEGSDWWTFKIYWYGAWIKRRLGNAEINRSIPQWGKMSAVTNIYVCYAVTATV